MMDQNHIGEIKLFDCCFSSCCC